MTRLLMQQLFSIFYQVKRISGAVAQLGERSVRIRKVEGSNPFSSTNALKQLHLYFVQLTLEELVLAILYIHIGKYD
jgi:hypothetical protein